MSKAETFEVNFGENKSIGVNVNFSKGDAIQVPVSINSLDAEKVGKEVGDRIAEKLDETALASVAKESTLLVESQRIQDAVRNIDLSSIENKIDNIKLPEIDTTELAKQGENQEATNSKIYDAVKSIPDLSLLYAARAEKNDDGVNTYSIVLPVTAKVTYDDNGVATIQL